MKSIIYKHALLAVSFIIFSQLNNLYATVDTVKIYNLYFSPDTIVINQGNTIVWKLMEGVHTTTGGISCIPGGLWNSGNLTVPGETFSFTFDTTGLYPYFCIPHCGSGMTGLIEVTKPVSYSEDLNTGVGSLRIYPNPFSNNAIIEYEILKYSKVTLKIYDLLGNEVKVLVNKSQDAGLYQIKVNTADLGFSNSVFFYSIKAGDFQKWSKMILVR